MRGLSTEEANLHWPPSGTRLKADSVHLEGAVRRHQFGCWRTEPVKCKVRYPRGGSGDKGVDIEEAYLQRPSEDLTCSPPLCHSVADRLLAFTKWIASGGPLGGHCFDVWRVTNHTQIQSQLEPYFIDGKYRQ